MRGSIFLAAVIAAVSVDASPFIRRRAPLAANDTSTLQLALYLEHIEFALYE